MPVPRIHEILLVGVGGIGRRHVEALSLSGRACVAICEGGAAVQPAAGA